LKIAFTSDFHINVSSKSMLSYLKRYLVENGVDIFCFAGDMSGNTRLSVSALMEIQNETGCKVLAVPGNHEMRDTSFKSSWEALEYFNQSLGDISLCHSPFLFSDYAIIGNMGWYDYSTGSERFTAEQQDKMEYEGKVTQDVKCNWNGWKPYQVAEYSLNSLKNDLERYKDKKIILMSHIIPYKKYVLFKNEPSWDYFNAYFGNTGIGSLLENYPVHYVHFGHTHTKFFDKLDKKTIICSPLGIEKEWETSRIETELPLAIKIIKI